MTSPISHDGYGPADGVFLITPSDTVNFTHATRAIRATVAGNVAVVLAGTDTAVVCAFAAGETRPIKAKRVNATSTTATGLEGMY